MWYERADGAWADDEISGADTTGYPLSHFMHANFHSFTPFAVDAFSQLEKVSDKLK